MKIRPIKGLALALIVTSSLSCNKTEVAWKPTYAVPLGTGSLEVGDLIGAQPSEIQDIYISQGADGDSIFSYELVYTDTLDPVSISNFGGNSGQPVPPVFGVALPESSTFLRMTGAASGGSFQFTNPRVTFDFINEMNMEIDLTIDSSYTKNINTGEERDLVIANQPTLIPAGDIGSPKTAQLLVNNTTTGGELSNVFSPTPKFLFYTPVLSTPGTFPDNANNGQLNIVSTVTLPFEGYGQVFFNDTIPLEIEDGDSIADLNLVDFAFLRFNFENEMPLEVDVTATLVNSTTFAFIDEIEFYNLDADAAGSNPYTIIPAGSKATPDTRMSEMRIYREHPTTGKDQISSVLSGNASIIFNFAFSTDDFENNTSVLVRSDQRLRTNVGFKTKLNLETEVPPLLDLVDSLGNQ